MSLRVGFAPLFKSVSRSFTESLLDTHLQEAGK